MPSKEKDDIQISHYEGDLGRTHSEAISGLKEVTAQDPVQLKSELDQLGLARTAWAFRKACFVCCLLCVAAGADGYQISLNGNIIANTGFIHHLGTPNAAGVYTLDANHVAIWGALQSLGQLIGMVFINPVSDKIGRKRTLYILWVVLFGSLMIETFVSTWQQWAGAKLLAGMGIGCIQSTLPVYITEWSPTNIRGAMLLSYAIFNNIGNFIAPLLLYFVQKAKPLDWRTPILTQWAFLGMMAPIFLWLPEVAAYYAARDQDENGRATLKRVNGNVPGYDVDHEYSIIKNTILQERARKAAEGDHKKGVMEILDSYVDCFRPANWRRTLGAALPICSQQLCGLAFLNTYASLFFRQSGFTNAFEITTIITAIKIVAILALVLTSDKIGRRPMVIGTTAVCTVTMMIVGALGLVAKTPANKIGLIVTACIWSMASAGLGALGWSYVGEVAAQHLRARTAGLAAGASVVFGLIFNTSVPIMLAANRANWGYKTAWLFFGTGLAALVVIVLFTPETAGRNSAELDELYERRIPAWKMKKTVTEVQLFATEPSGQATR